MYLPDEFLESARPHELGKRRLAPPQTIALRRKEVGIAARGSALCHRNILSVENPGPRRRISRRLQNRRYGPLLDLAVARATVAAGQVAVVAILAAFHEPIAAFRRRADYIGLSVRVPR